MPNLMAILASIPLDFVDICISTLMVFADETTDLEKDFDIGRPVSQVKKIQTVNFVGSPLVSQKEVHECMKRCIPSITDLDGNGRMKYLCT